MEEDGREVKGRGVDWRGGERRERVGWGGKEREAKFIFNCE